MTGILILIGSLGCLNEVKTMGMMLGKNVNFQIVFFLIFRNICCRYTLELLYQIVFSLFSVTYDVGTNWNCLYETIPMCTNIICLFNK